MLATVAICTTSLLDLKAQVPAPLPTPTSHFVPPIQNLLSTQVEVKSLSNGTCPSGVVTFSCPVWKSGSPEALAEDPLHPSEIWQDSLSHISPGITQEPETLLGRRLSRQSPSVELHSALPEDLPDSQHL